MPRDKRINPTESVKTSIYLKRPIHSAMKKRAIDLGIRDTALMERAVEQFLVTDMEQLYICIVCKSASSAGCNHVQISGIAESVLKTEQSFTQALTLGEDEYSLIETWRRAKDVGFIEWKEMLLSIRRQMELVARAADREKELMAIAEREAAKAGR